MIASRDCVIHFSQRIRDGLDANVGFWERVRDEAAVRVPLVGEVAAAYKQHLTQPAAGDAAVAGLGDAGAE